VLVQDPAEAGHEGMPRAAISAEIADIVLPVQELAARLVELAQHKARLAPLMGSSSGEAKVSGDHEVALKRIFDLVRVRTGHDFSRYKRATILRRLARRMQLNHCTGLEQYVAYLREKPEEIQSLFDDLLISVTTFFRDPLAWESVRTQVIIPLVERSKPKQPIRVWVPGCATGEEAYTLAILFREEIARRDVHCDLVIFGSDVDQIALATARDGIYPNSIAADVSEQRLARYFRAEGDHYRVATEIRDCVVFAVHSVLRDPPFSKLHLISCRNLLIYLDRELQQQLQSVFRYGVRDDDTCSSAFRSRPTLSLRARRQAIPHLSRTGARRRTAREACTIAGYTTIAGDRRTTARSGLPLTPLGGRDPYRDARGAGAPDRAGR